MRKRIYSLLYTPDISGKDALLSILILSIAIVCLVTLAAVAAGAPDGAGDDPAAIPEPGVGELVVVQSYSLGAEPGTIHVTSTVHVGAEIRDVRPTPPERATVTGMDGFDGPDADGRLRWDRETDRPSFEWQYEANETSDRFTRSTWLGTAEWAVAKTARPTTWMRYTKGIETSRTYVHRTAGPGVAGSDVVFLGEHTAVRGETGGESLRIVVPDAVSADLDPRALRDDLLAVADRLETGARADDAVSPNVVERGEHAREVLAVVGPSPLSGGVASGENFWVGESRLADSPETAFHEYAHTRQRYDGAGATAWTVEGGAVYYAALYEWLHGHATFQDLRETLARGETYGDAVSLADPGTWTGTSADYRAGGLTVAALDAALRRDGTGTVDDVYARLNARDDEISRHDFAAAVRAVGGEAADRFVEQYVHGTDRPPVPADPYRYRGIGPATDLDVELEGRELATNRTGTVHVRLANRGARPSVAPAVSVALPDGWSIVDARGAVEHGEATYRVTDGTPPDGSGVATTTIRPGESRTVALDVAVPDLASRERHAVGVEAFDVGNSTANATWAGQVGPNFWASFLEDVRRTADGAAGATVRNSGVAGEADGHAGFVPVVPALVLGALARILDRR